MLDLGHRVRSQRHEEDLQVVDGETFTEVVPNTFESPDSAADSVTVTGSSGADSFYLTAGDAEREATGGYTSVVVTRASGGSTLYVVTLLQSVRGEGDNLTVDSSGDNLLDGNDVLDASGLGAFDPMRASRGRIRSL